MRNCYNKNKVMLGFLNCITLFIGEDLILNRTKAFVANTVVNYVSKLGNMAISFLNIPLMLGIMGAERFGIWQTILTIITWAELANFGVGNGLRNKVTELLSRNQKNELKYYISSAYYILLLLSLIIAIISMIIIGFLNTDLIFRDTSIHPSEIKFAILIVLLNFIINFILGLVNSILYGLQKSSIVTIGQFLNSLSIFLVLTMLKINEFENVKIGLIALVYLVVTSFINILISIVVFKKYVERPVYKNVNKIYGKELLKVGVTFFILQITTIFVFSIDNFLVSILLGAKEVAAYSIATKLLIIFNTLFSILLIQMWNASGDAFNKNDYRWIQKMIKRLYLVLIIMSIGIIIIIILFDTITKLWLGQTISISMISVRLIAICVIVQMFNGIAVNIENGTGLIRPQIISYLISGIINIPLAVYLVKVCNMGLNGIIIAKIICLLIPSVVCSIHVRKVLLVMKKSG